jgi:uncharacterized protein (TIGR03032 family)
MDSVDFRTSIECRMEEGFCALIESLGMSIVISTYQASKLVTVGWDNGAVRVACHDFERPMGVAFHGDLMALGTREAVHLLANATTLAKSFPKEGAASYDCLFLPRVTLHTGDIDIHELAFDSKGELWMCNTMFSCLSVPSQRFNFELRWRPPFISDWSPEDRCHLNGLAMSDGKPAFVTCFGQTDYYEGWRESKRSGGCVVGIESNEVIARELCMPHSPRVHDGYLWLLNSGAGELLRIGVASGQTEVVVKLPGYLRGLAIQNGVALVGMSKMRGESQFTGLPLHETPTRLECGVVAIHLESGRILGRFHFSNGCTEVFDVQFLSVGKVPAILNHEQPESKQAYTMRSVNFWIR